MKNKEIKQLEELGLEEEQIEIYQALVSDLSRKYTSEQAEMLALYIILRANAITNSIFDKDF
ncbi:hypothetical protein MMJ61_12085 [Enterococcus cecorum]|jgi:sugar-specific transcriptional regulator TrmB|uniref:hypothetical protein n=1 Tax=Enterococcus TaxID=1350 RepID=UPI0007615D48|nr:MULTISPECIES: hypothetical protein [Enterococcus]MCJ0535196.1 hypothetical protein [Enterococcus cecorum]MCJ0572888.1 hypothetical protein [Enterococcus cecorum]MDZ5547176.1 hypothetical protein [Enterococcus cecorum]MDZ5579613.1 hypothetical protein [Enterococcus cecorum]MDZ5581378.1 hypothetical protein [Enterococcus cecorum]